MTFAPIIAIATLALNAPVWIHSSIQDPPHAIPIAVLVSALLTLPSFDALLFIMLELALLFGLSANQQDSVWLYYANRLNRLIIFATVAQTSATMLFVASMLLVARSLQQAMVADPPVQADQVSEFLCKTGRTMLLRVKEQIETWTPPRGWQEAFKGPSPSPDLNLSPNHNLSPNQNQKRTHSRLTVTTTEM